MEARGLKTPSLRLGPGPGCSDHWLLWPVWLKTLAYSAWLTLLLCGLLHRLGPLCLIPQTEAWRGRAQGSCCPPSALTTVVLYMLVPLQLPDIQTNEFRQQAQCQGKLQASQTCRHLPKQPCYIIRERDFPSSRGPQPHLSVSPSLGAHDHTWCLLCQP
jgi:hypothetical protein